mgnify:CR=1 FL=1
MAVSLLGDRVLVSSASSLWFRLVCGTWGDPMSVFRPLRGVLPVGTLEQGEESSLLIVN